MTLEELCRDAKDASRVLSRARASQKNSALGLIASSLENSAARIRVANAGDLEKAEKNGRDEAFLDRLKIDDARIGRMARSVVDVMELEDPVGATIRKWKRPNGLEIEKTRVPIGVIGIIYEARPDVSIEAASLCLKSGNSVILRGGSDAYGTNRVLAEIMNAAAAEAGLPAGCVSMLDDTSRGAVLKMLGMTGFIDLIIPRGGEGLIKMVSENSRIPVIKHYKGVCHVFVDASADLKMAEEICFNAKVQRPSVCNAMEAMLVHEDSAGRFLPGMLKRFSAAGVEILGDRKTTGIFRGAKPAGEGDWGKEFLALRLAVKVVATLGEAVEHINTYGSSHSDAIVTNDYSSAREFLESVDSAAVYVNASTRFTDGGEFGFGAEMGISTDRLHARGPMALEELTTYKYLVYGTGQVRE